MRVITVTTGTATLLGDGSVTFSGATPAYVSSIPVFQPIRNPDLGASSDEEPSVYKVKFGDGYSQRTPKGMNNMEEGMSLTWTALSHAYKDSILGFFRERAGYKPFFYGLPNDRCLMWIAPKWSRGVLQPNGWLIRAAIQRVYDPVP